MKSLVSWWSSLQPLTKLLLLGGFFRLLAAVFSKGFGWSDDHFLIIEPAQNWADGFDNYWLPSKSDPTRAPQGHPLLYVGINYVILKALMWLGMGDPQAKMLVIRLLHAAWSLLVITFGYRILLSCTDRRTAWYGGLGLALYWIFPFLSVRNLAEFVCVPPLLWATWLLVKDTRSGKSYFAAGLLIGLAFSFRFQAIIYAAGFAIPMIATRVRFSNILLTIGGFVLVAVFTQGLQDQLIWKRPFAEFSSYVEYNLNNAANYGTDAWYMYPALLLGLLIPPLSLALFAGWIASWKRAAFLFWPVLVFLVFHSSFPNKQERFITTILPSFIICGATGMKLLYDRGIFRPRRTVIRWCAAFSIALNMVLLPLLTFSYSKRHRVEAMYYLYRKNDSYAFIVEDSNKENDFLLPPLYYYGKWISVQGITRNNPADSVRVYFERNPGEPKPRYVVFWQAENIQERVAMARKAFPGLAYETTIQPSLLDKLLFWLNPLNDNQTSYIYRIPQ